MIDQKLFTEAMIYYYQDYFKNILQEPVIKYPPIQYTLKEKIYRRLNYKYWRFRIWLASKIAGHDIEDWD